MEGPGKKFCDINQVRTMPRSFPVPSFGIMLIALFGVSSVGSSQTLDLTRVMEGILFQPHPSSYRDSEDILKLKTSDGAVISAVYLPVEGARQTILYSHGNAEDLGNLQLLLKAFQAVGFSVLAYDYHGYGTSEGKPSEKATYLDVDAAYDYLTKNLSIRPESILVHGRSLGGAVSVDLAARKPHGGLVLESTFLSAMRVAFPDPDPRMDRFRSLEKMAGVKGPILIIHGTADEVIPFAHGQRLFAAANEPKRFFWVKNAGHNNLLQVAQGQFWNVLRDFAELVRETQGTEQKPTGVAPK